MNWQPISRKRAFWDLAICGAGGVYLALTLWLNLDSPVVGLALIVLAAHELVEPRRRRNNA